MKDRARILAAIPCYNEAKSIQNIVSRTRKYVGLVLVVDDGSTDDTATLAQKAGATVIRHDQNRGKGMAMNTAFAKAQELGAAVLVLLDGDGQHDPDELPRVLCPVLSGEADVVIGSRFLNGGRGIPFYRTIGQRILTLVANLSTGMKMTDTQSGFRAFSARAIAALRFQERQLGSVESETQFLIGQKGLKAMEVPITAIYREKAKRNPVIQGFSTLWLTVQLAFRYRPSILLTLLGLALFSLGTVGAVIIIVGGLAGDALVGHWSGAAALSAIVAGLLVASAAFAVNHFSRSRKGSSES